MAKRKNTQTKSKAKPKSKSFSLRQPEFKPDAKGAGLMKMLYMTRLQRLTLLKWVLYAAVCVLLLVIQDVIMSRITLFGTTTDLPVCPILLITVMEGSETGSVFVLIASAIYYFSGSAPGPYCVALLTILGIGASLFRQQYWHRNRSSIVLCSGLALVLYEILVFAVGIFFGLTRWSRFGAFLIKGLLSWVVLLPLYSLIYLIGQIGGNTWKE